MDKWRPDVYQKISSWKKETEPDCKVYLGDEQKYIKGQVIRVAKS